MIEATTGHPSTSSPLVLRAPPRNAALSTRTFWIAALAVGIGFVATGAAWTLRVLIAAVTNLAFYGRLSLHPVEPAGHHLGHAVVLVPVLGGLLVGLMARYGSAAIRGHGIPEAMEQVLFNESRVPARMTLLKPLSSAIAIGTGGPFGAEGPIIATGSAFGSLVGQTLTVTANERRTLLAAGAAAGMSATFGSPVSAVLLAIELLLFEYRARSAIPVVLAAVTAASARGLFEGHGPVFPMPAVAPLAGGSLAFDTAVGLGAGLLAVLVTRALYATEDLFERLPLHWTWWPAIGGLVVGLVGDVAPRALGVGYANITDLLGGRLTLGAALLLCVWKYVSWNVALGSGTSGGTLAPLFTLGAGYGLAAGAVGARLLPHLGIDPRVTALVGMAALFTGASRALLASVVFAFETTQQPAGLLPLLSGCAAAWLVSSLLMPHSIMTEKIARRGRKVTHEYAADTFALKLVRDHATIPARALDGEARVCELRAAWLDAPDGRRHQAFPVLDEAGQLLGVVTRREVLDAGDDPDLRVRALIRRPPVVVFEDSSLREAADHMVTEGVGRLVVVTRDAPERPVGILTRSDLLRAHERRLHEDQRPQRGRWSRKRRARS